MTGSVYAPKSSMFVQAIETSKTVLGPEHPDTLTIEEIIVPSFLLSAAAVTTWIAPIAYESQIVQDRKTANATAKKTETKVSKPTQV